MHEKFFSLAELKQPVNQWICIAFLCLWCFWIVLYFTVQRTQDIGDSFMNNFNTIASNGK
jgi:hypothetical protein